MKNGAIYRIASITTLASVVLANSTLADVQVMQPNQSLANTVARVDTARIFQDGDTPKIRLQDGQEFPLMPLSEQAKQSLKETAAVQKQGGSLQLYSASSTPGYVDHRAYHGSIRNQGGRGTCVSFSATAAVEGRYRRMNFSAYRNLDLAEQWANHIQKMVSLRTHYNVAQASWMENDMGCWGSSNNHYMLKVFQKYGLTQEGVMPYNSSGSYENTNEATDNPRVDRSNIMTPQRTIDDFNLNTANLPHNALDKAPYRPTGIVLLNSSQARNPSYLEGLLAAGNDVIIDLSIASPLYRTAEGWKAGPDSKAGGGHSVLLVGYNRTKKYFIVRNSWGADTSTAGDDGSAWVSYDDGYTRINYNYIQSYAYSGSYVSAVAAPETDTSRARLYIGRWKMNHDGWPGTLDISRLPGLFTKPELKGQTDYRLGTYFGHDGKAFRVNGYLWGEDLVFYINFGKSNLPFGELTGTAFVANLFSWDEQTLAGMEYQGGQTYSFHATKGTTPSHVAASSPATLRDAHLGHWKLNHDGWKGDLYLHAGATADAVWGTYRDGDGTWHWVRGTLTGRNLRFEILFGEWQSFSGYIYSWDKGLMSGLCWWNGRDFGFTAARVGA